jgi:hypothetical protein
VIAIAEFSLALKPSFQKMIGSEFWAAVALFILAMGVLALMTIKNFFLKKA